VIQLLSIALTGRFKISNFISIVVKIQAVSVFSAVFQVPWEGASVVGRFAFQFFGEVFRLFKAKVVARKGIASICPCSEIDRLASFATEGAKGVVLKGGFFSAGGAFDLFCHSFLKEKPP